MQHPKRTPHPKTKKHATPGTSRNCVQILGAVNQIRTGDLFLTKASVKVRSITKAREKCDKTDGVKQLRYKIK